MKTTFTMKEHRAHCQKAGCKHPAFYGRSEGWCLLCRTVAFGEERALHIEAHLEAVYARKPRPS